MNHILQKNILWMVSSRFGSQILAIASGLILARYLGRAGFGEYAFISAIIMIGNAFSTFGTDMVLIRRISSENNYSDIPTALLIQLLISIIFIVGIFIFYFFFPLTPSLLVYSFALIPLSFFTIFTIILRGAQEMQAFSFLHFFVSFLQLIAAFLLILERGNITQLAILLLIVQIFAALFGYMLCVFRIKKIFFQSKFSLNNIFPLLRTSFQLAIIGTLRLVYEKLAVSLLPILSNVNTTGLFSASLRVMDSSKLGYISALTAIYPEMSRDKKFTTHQTGFGLLLFTASFLSLIIFLFAKQITFILFGNQFIASVESLKILAWILIPYVVTSYYSLGFVALEIEKPVLVSLIASLLLILTLLVILNPLYGLRGAALALLSAEMFQASLLWLQWRSYAFSKSPE